MTQFTLAVVAALHLAYFKAGDNRYAMKGLVVVDPMGHLFGFFATLAVMVTLVYSRPMRRPAR